MQSFVLLFLMATAPRLLKAFSLHPRTVGRSLLSPMPPLKPTICRAGLFQTPSDSTSELPDVSSVAETPETVTTVHTTDVDRTTCSIIAIFAVAQLSLLAPEPAWASTSVLLSQGFADWKEPVRYILDPALNIGQFFMLLRVIFSWSPEINVTKMPYLLVTFFTESTLRATRNIVPPAFGVDVSPVVWIAILSFFREILFGQQGLFNIM